MVKKFIHWLNHLFGSNTGNIVAFEENGKRYIAFECTECGKIDPSTINEL